MAVKSLIETVTVGAGGAASIEFLDIPQDGSDLVLVMSLRTTTTGRDVALLLNGTTTGYSGKQLRGSGSTASSFASTSQYFLPEGATSTAYTANTFSNVHVYFSNYTSSNTKSISADYVQENNAATSWQYLVAETWNNTAAITSIKTDSAALAEHTTASLYKIKYD